MADGKAPNTSLPPDYLDRLLKILANLPKRSLQSRKVINTIVEFLRKVQGTALAKKQYVEIWDQIWAASTSSPSEDREISDPVGYAINDPAGKLTEDLLKYLWPKDAKVNGGISSDLANRLKKIVQRTDHSAIDASSVIVASRAEVFARSCTRIYQARYSATFSVGILTQAQQRIGVHFFGLRVSALICLSFLKQIA
ncbi:hypothetical protein QW131_13605 [Roseibium salinum]|nr:hypothetical protein [Roseibium salinum]